MSLFLSDRPMFVLVSRDLNDRYPEVVGQIFHHLEPHLASDSVESFSRHLPSVNLKHDMVRNLSKHCLYQVATSVTLSKALKWFPMSASMTS